MQTQRRNKYNLYFLTTLHYIKSKIMNVDPTCTILESQIRIIEIIFGLHFLKFIFKLFSAIYSFNKMFLVCTITFS